MCAHARMSRHTWNQDNLGVGSCTSHGVQELKSAHQFGNTCLYLISHLRLSLISLPSPAFCTCVQPHGPLLGAWAPLTSIQDYWHFKRDSFPSKLSPCSLAHSALAVSTPVPLWPPRPAVKPSPVLPLLLLCTLFLGFVWFCLKKKSSCYVVQASFKLEVLLLPKHWDCTRTSSPV